MASETPEIGNQSFVPHMGYCAHYQNMEAYRRDTTYETYEVVAA
jgi:hypothetical protein